MVASIAVHPRTLEGIDDLPAVTPELNTLWTNARPSSQTLACTPNSLNKTLFALPHIEIAPTDTFDEIVAKGIKAYLDTEAKEEPTWQPSELFMVSAVYEDPKGEKPSLIYQPGDINNIGVHLKKMPINPDPEGLQEFISLYYADGAWDDPWVGIWDLPTKCGTFKWSDLQLRWPEVYTELTSKAAVDQGFGPPWYVVDILTPPIPNSERYYMLGITPKIEPYGVVLGDVTRIPTAWKSARAADCQLHNVS